MANLSEKHHIALSQLYYKSRVLIKKDLFYRLVSGNKFERMRPRIAEGKIENKYKWRT
jgi:hypothetical protein